MTDKKSFMQKIIAKKLKGYKHQFNLINTELPKQIAKTKKVAIIGGGLAGASAAIVLAERGFNITLYEKNSYWGGKVGSWPYTFSDGFSTNIEHGFHAFFRQYYNLRYLLDKIGAAKHLIPISDYLILKKDLSRFEFKNINTTPILNLLSLRKEGVYSFSDIMLRMKSEQMTAFLKYDPQKTFDRYDDISFEKFTHMARLPDQMRIIFTTFARAFFAEPHYISMAELIKSFHFYFLSNDLGLLYDVLDDDFEQTLWQPTLNYLHKYNGELKLNTPVDMIDISENKFKIHKDEYDYLILATDIPGTKKIVTNSTLLQEKYPAFYENILKQKISQKYAVLRIWIDKNLQEDLPFFIFTDSLKVLDSITLYHKMEKSSAQWVEKNGGGIFELHSYAVPENIDQEAEIRTQLLKEFEHFCPQIRGYRILYEYMQLKEDFTAFHTNLYQNRSPVKTEIDNLFLAGDWVKIPTPAMLMEAATTSALFAANNILQKEGLQEEPIYSVPLKGIFA